MCIYILPQLNRVYLIFDQPTAISMIKIWNYSKTANRGAKDFAVSVLLYFLHTSLALLEILSFIETNADLQHRNYVTIP